MQSVTWEIMIRSILCGYVIQVFVCVCVRTVHTAQ